MRQTPSASILNEYSRAWRRMKKRLGDAGGINGFLEGFGSGLIPGGSVQTRADAVDGNFWPGAIDPSKTRHGQVIRVDLVVARCRSTEEGVEYVNWVLGQAVYKGGVSIGKAQMGMFLDDDPIDAIALEAIEVVLGPDPAITREVTASQFYDIVAGSRDVVVYGLQIAPASERLACLG